MNGRDFLKKVDETDAVVLLGFIEGRNGDEDEVVIQDARSGVKRAIKFRSVAECEWEDLLALIQGRRNNVVMIHMSRVVGYYGQIQNWNRSKVAELRDRQKGNYSVPDRTPDLKADLPREVIDALAKGGAEMSCEIGGGR